MPKEIFQFVGTDIMNTAKKPSKDGGKKPAKTVFSPLLKKILS